MQACVPVSACATVVLMATGWQQAYSRPEPAVELAGPYSSPCSSSSSSNTSTGAICPAHPLWTLPAQGQLVEVLLNGMRVHASSTAASLAKRPAELSFRLEPEHGLPELSGSSLYLRVRLPASRAVAGLSDKAAESRPKSFSRPALSL